MKDPVVLRLGKDKAIRQRHPWIFSGAIASGLGKAQGELRPVTSSKGDLLGWAYFNSKCSIAGRMICFSDQDPLAAVRHHVERAVALRRTLFTPQTTGYRVINAEGDFLPGFIADLYDDTLVIQVSTLGMTKLQDVIVEQLVPLLGISRVYEKSITASRTEEGLALAEKWLIGEPKARIPFKENGLRYIADVVEGQKTGFFLDQRDMRQQVQRLAKDKRVLNCFCYSGAFTVAALAGGAKQVTSVDISPKAIELAKEHVAMNGGDIAKHEFVTADVFDYLRQAQLDYDIVILDPPAFVKRKSDVVKACRGYKDINRVAMKGIPVGSLLLTSSCSHFVDDTLFQQVVFQAAVEAGRQVRILDRHHYAGDHPESIFHPEGHYLKSLLLAVD